MNYLAHMTLSCSDEYLLMGNFMADMIKNKEVDALAPELKRGIDLHRLIDSFTDNHEEVSKVNALLHPNHHKYAPVISDVLFDFVLVKNWDKYGQGNLKSFTNLIYDIVSSQIDLIPKSKHPMVKSMIKDDFLMKYTTYEGLEFVFNKMSKRLRYKASFELAVGDLHLHYKMIDQHFNAFFPDMVKEVNNFCNC